MELLDGRTVERRVERAVSVEERRHNREEAGTKCFLERRPPSSLTVLKEGWSGRRQEAKNCAQIRDRCSLTGRMSVS